MIKILGFGSLICEDWARETCPGLTGFKLVRLKNLARVFGKVNPQSLYRGDSNFETLEMASCFLEPMPGCAPLVSVFEIPQADWPGLEERELDYKHKEIPYYDMEGREAGRALAFFGYDSDDAMNRDNPALRERYWPKIRAHYEGPIYRDDLRPETKYLERCLKACASQGEAVVQNFLETSYLGDRKTSIKTFMANGRGG